MKVRPLAVRIPYRCRAPHPVLNEFSAAIPGLTPILDLQTRHSPELPRIVSDKANVEAHGMSGDQEVHRADRLAPFLERSAQTAVCSGRRTIERDDSKWRDELMKGFAILGRTSAGARTLLELRERHH